MQEQYQRIPLDRLHESPTNPRRFYPEQPLNELAESIRQHDVLQAILTRPHPFKAGDFEIVCGSRRFRGTKIAQRPDIPAMVRDLSDEEVIVIQAIENIQREDVHPLEEAQSYRALLGLGQEVAGIAAKVGKTVTYVYQRVKLLDLCDDAQAAFLADKFSAAHAIELARLPETAQRELLDYIKEGTQYGDAVTVAELREEIEQRFHLDLHRASFKKSDAQLVPEAGSCTTCQKRTGYLPALFPDIKKKDTCTDRACFHAKVVAFIERTRADLAKDGDVVPLLSIFYGGTPKNSDALSHSEWTEAKKKCKHTVQGVVVDGHEAGRVLTVCTEASCSVHRSKGSADTASGTGQPKRAKVALTPQQLTAKRKESAKRAAKERAIVAVVGKTKALNGPDLKLVARALIGEMWNDHLKELFKRRGWEPKKQGHGRDYDDAARGYIEKMDAAEVSGFLIECALRGRAMNGFFGKPSDSFASEAKRHGVDLAKLEKEALAEISGKEKARAKSTAAKAETPKHKVKTKRKAA